MIRFDAYLQLLADTTTPDGSGLFYDAPRRRYLVPGTAPAAAGGPGGGLPVILALGEADLGILREQSWSDGSLPELYAAAGSGRLLAASRYGASRLYSLDPASLQPTARTILGVKLQGMALDASDSQGGAGGASTLLMTRGASAWWTLLTADRVRPGRAPHRWRSTRRTTASTSTPAMRQGRLLRQAEWSHWIAAPAPSWRTTPPHLLRQAVW